MHGLSEATPAETGGRARRHDAPAALRTWLSLPAHGLRIDGWVVWLILVGKLLLLGLLWLLARGLRPSALAAGHEELRRDVAPTGGPA